MAEIVQYRIEVPPEATKPWVKMVRDVRPERGNGYDILGPFVKTQGFLREGTLLCVGMGMPDQWGEPKVRYWAGRVVQGRMPEANVIWFASSVDWQPTMPVVEEACAAFPALGTIAGRAIFPVEWALLRALREWQAQEGARRQQAASALEQMWEGGQQTPARRSWPVARMREQHAQWREAKEQEDRKPVLKVWDGGQGRKIDLEEGEA